MMLMMKVFFNVTCKQSIRIMWSKEKYVMFEKFSTEIGLFWRRIIVTLCGELWQKLAAIANTNCDGNDPQLGVAFIYRCVDRNERNYDNTSHKDDFDNSVVNLTIFINVTNVTIVIFTNVTNVTIIIFTNVTNLTIIFFTNVTNFHIFTPAFTVGRATPVKTFGALMTEPAGKFG